MSIILFLIILIALIMVHEFGHFFVAKRSKIRVDEFGLGFPPRIWGVRKGETIYSLNMIPFGGFVKIFGEDPNHESIEGPDRERSFVHKPKIVQAAVLVSGVFFNLLFAWALLATTLMIGFPMPADALPASEVSRVEIVVTEVKPDSPAAKSGFELGDRILGVREGEAVLQDLQVTSIQQFVGAREGKELMVKLERNGEEKTVTVVPVSGITPDRAAMGIAMESVGVWRLPPHRAIFEGGKMTANMFVATGVGFGTMISNIFKGAADFSEVTGPVGIVGLVGDAADFGFVYLLTFTALISINLAFINLVPFPALDGGRLLFVIIEAIRRKPITPYVANAANTIGFVLLILLMLVVTYQDIVRLF